MSNPPQSPFRKGGGKIEAPLVPLLSKEGLGEIINNPPCFPLAKREVKFVPLPQNSLGKGK
jgi:hypothetical protein